MAEIKKFLDSGGLTYFCKKFQDYPSNEILGAVINAIDNTKVDKVEGKVLSTNDYTNEDKNKLDSSITFNEQNLSNEQQAQARENIGAADAAAESGRVAAENARVAAEQARANAENERAGAETLRAAAETDRANAESGRVSAEQGRVSAESERVAAEEARATEFAGFSGEITQLKGEIEELKGSHLTEIGATPLRVERDTPGVILRSDGECAYTIKSDTVINTDTMTFVEKNITLTHYSFYELAPAATVTQWYNSYATVYISGLTIGEEYSLVIDCRNVAFDSANYISGGYYRLFKGTAAAETEKQFAVTQEGLSVTNFTAVAETQWLRIWAYDGIKYDVTKSIARFRDIYINRANGGTEKSEIINVNGTFNGKINIGDVPAYVTIDSSPACNVYKLAAETDNLDDMLREYGMPHYTWQNDILTVYQAGTKTEYGYHGNNNIMMCKGYGLEDAFVPFKTDILSPMILTASENADGDLDDSYRLTGGNHSYAQTSGTPSANTVLVEVYADGKPAGASGLFNTLTLHARHKVQAWNTEKADGTGRAVLVEDDYITWDGKRMNVEIHLTPTENVVISEYYGLQLAEIEICNVYGGKVKKNIETGGYTDEVPYFIEGICNGFRIRMHLDETGLGKYTYNTTAIKYSKNDYRKAYFRPIGESHSFTADDCLWLRGYFEILPPVSV